MRKFLVIGIVVLLIDTLSKIFRIDVVTNSQAQTIVHHKDHDRLHDRIEAQMFRSRSCIVSAWTQLT